MKNLKKYFVIILFLSLYIFGFSLAFTAKAITCGPGLRKESLGVAICGPSSYEATGVCTFSHPTVQTTVVTCEYCTYQYVQAFEGCIDDNSGITVTTGYADGSVCTKQAAPNACAPQQVSGCTSNANCPHPPGIVCDTYCDLSAGSPGSCQQVDPSCSGFPSFSGYCGDGLCNASGGETNANCSVDCPVILDPANWVISVSPLTRSIIRGGSTDYSVIVTPTNGYNAKVALDAICPAGATCFISADANPTSGEPGTVDLSYGIQTATLQVYNTSGISIGTFNVDVVGIGGGFTHRTYPQLKVNPGVPSFFSANLTGVCPSRTVTLTWGAGQDANGYRLYRSTTNAQPATPFAVVGNVLTFADNPAPGATYYYWIDSISNPTGNTSAAIPASSSVVVTICPPKPNIKANGSDGPIYVSYNGTVTISWTSTDSTSCAVSSNPSINSWIGLSGSQTSANITVDTSFTETCQGPGGNDSDTVLVRVPPTPTITSSTCPAPGTSGTIAWTLPSGFAQSIIRAYDLASSTPCSGGPNQLCTGADNRTTINFNSSSAPAMISGHNYVWWVHTYESSGALSNAVSGSFTCGVTPSTASLTINGSHNPAKVSYGSTVTVAWTSTNEASCSVTSSPSAGSWSGLSGSQTSPVLTANTTIYTLSCTNASGGVLTDTVQVDIPPVPTSSSASCPAPGTSGSINWTLPSGYTQILLRAYDTATTWTCGAGQVCTGGIGGTSYPLSSTTTLAMIPNHNYGYWLHTYEPVSGTYSNSIGGSFSCTGQASFTLSPTTIAFTAAVNTAPAQQILGVTNTGTANLNYTATTNQSWCRVNTVNNTGSVLGWIGSPPTNQAQNVAISVDGLSIPGTYNCTVTVSDPAAAVPNPKTVAVTYTVSANPLQAICDSTWRDVPGGGYTPSQAVGAWVPASGNIQSNNANVVVVRGGGADNQIYYQFCSNSSNPCIWNASYTPLGGTTVYPPFVEVPTFWNVYHYGMDNNTYLKYNSSAGWQGSWNSQGVVAKSWGQPFRWTDSSQGRVWQTKTTSTGAIQYYCGGIEICQPLNYQSAKSSLSTGSVPAGGAFTARCDYDSSGINAITATVSGGGSCSFSSFDKTTAVFNCTAGATLGNQTVTCNLGTVAPSNVCAQSNVLGTVNVTSAAQASFILNPTTMAFSGSTGGSAPSGQVLQIVSNGTSDVWYTATSNQSWCKINGATSQPGAVGWNPPGSFTPVMITVDSPSTVGVGTHSCIISVVDPLASTTTRTLTVTYTVTNPVGGAGPATVSLDNSTCGQMTINWSAVTSATSYNVYRNTTGSAPVAGDLVQSGITSLTWTNVATLGSYYYWVSAIVGGVETTKVAPNSGATLNPSAIVVCGQGNLTSSDKDIISINSSSYTSNNCGGTDALASGTSLKLGDKIKFQINLCNDSGTGTSSNITITDTLTNLQMVTGQLNFNAIYNGVSLTYDGAVGGSSCTPSGNNHYCAYGTVPNQTLVFNLTSNANSVPTGLRRNLTFDAQITVPSGYMQSSGRFQNSFIINYNASLGAPASVRGSTPLILFSTGKGVPIIIEVP